MDVENVKSWVSQPDVCRCCLSASGTWDVTASYITDAGSKEVYSEMLQECYGITLSYLMEWGPSRMVCALCVGHLRDASRFRRQVEDAEKHFVTYCGSKKGERVMEESSESSDPISEHSDITTHLDFHKHYDVDPEGTTPELDSPDLFTDNEGDCNIPANKVSIGTNTENHEEVKEDINMDTINKCYTLGLIIGRALGTMSKQRREHCMHNIAHCFENEIMNTENIRAELDQIPDNRESPHCFLNISDDNEDGNMDVIKAESTTIEKENNLLLKRSKLNEIGPTSKKKKPFRKGRRKRQENDVKEDLDSDTPIAELSKNIVKEILSKDENELTDNFLKDNGNTYLEGSVDEIGPLIGLQHARTQIGVKQVSERKRVMLTCDTVLRDTTACPFRHHKSWFQCFFCPQEFMEINLLRNHMLKTHADIDVEIKKIKRYPRSLQIEISNLECRQCNLNLTDVISMCRHFVEVHKKVIYNECIADYKVDASPYSCHLCGQQFHVFRTLTTHLNEHYANCICDVCGKSFLNSKRLKVHKRTHENGNFPCAECGKILKTKTSKANHMESAHSKRVIKCQICFKPMKHYNDRIKHMSEAHDITHKFKCPICGREYNIKHYLATHIRQTHGQKNKNCSECGMAFITNHGLKKHMLKHSGLKPFSCNICCKSYARNYTLREHMRAHDNDKRFVEAD